MRNPLHMVEALLSHWVIQPAALAWLATSFGLRPDQLIAAALLCFAGRGLGYTTSKERA